VNRNNGKDGSPVPKTILKLFNAAFVTKHAFDISVKLFKTFLREYRRKLNLSDNIRKFNSLRSLFRKYIAIENRTYTIVGYGSLVNARSRARTAKTILSECPVDISGWARVFNLPHGSKGGTVLNVTEKADSSISAVLIEVEGREMFRLFAREFNYDVVPVPKESISFPYDKTIELTHEPLIFVGRVNKSKDAPLEEYVQACIFGANRISKKFLEKFIDSSYIYDMTPLKEYMTETYGDATSEKFKHTDSRY
jgi:hypothetical protein